MQLGKCLKITTIMLAVGAILLAVAYFMTEYFQIIFGSVALIILAVALTLKLINYRCPHCGEMLPLFGKLPEYCKMCGHYMKNTDTRKK